MSFSFSLEEVPEGFALIIDYSDGIDEPIIIDVASEAEGVDCIETVFGSRDAAQQEWNRIYSAAFIRARDLLAECSHSETFDGNFGTTCRACGAMVDNSKGMQ